MHKINRLKEVIKHKQGPVKQDFPFILLLISNAILFLPFTVLIIFGDTGKEFIIPSQFSLSTIVLIASSWIVYKAKDSKNNDRIKQFKCYLIALLVLGSLFLALQYSGWDYTFNLLNNQDKDITFVIVMVHGVHFLVAMTLVLVTLINTLKIQNNAYFYIHFLDPKVNMFLKRTFRFWDFLTFLWVIIFSLMLLKTGLKSQ
ncbi:hypothetical protein EZ449_22065 [Pedobacter frigidisoli]|uniref:Heme-copper oxidase subunit III family profile domain-containing protein n=1 Tax=Pedobacter frigidisoli TaxID=2530455 RepID=A0A4R0NDZ4_9SPHI|nr:hypothetical protein [Pedobacter frigidisoli]TCC97332.1 hypothetical protein EZ449_22065 [Pedobacter frigidisoli]